MSSEVVLRLRWVAGREGTDPQQAWLQATSQTRFHTYATLGCCVTRRYAPAPACAGGHERPVCIGRACDNGARGACALCRTPQGPRPRAAPSRPSRNAHPGALPPVVLQADGGFDCRFKGRWTAGASPALRGPGERGRWGEVQFSPGFSVPSTSHLWLRTESPRQAVLDKCPLSASWPRPACHAASLTSATTVPLPAALRDLVRRKPLLPPPPPQVELNQSWNWHPFSTSGRPSPTGSLRPAEVELARGEGAAVSMGRGELISSSPTPTRAAPLYRGRESGRHVGSVQGWTPTALLEHPGRDSSRGGPGSSGGPEDNLLRSGRPLPGRLPTGQPQFRPPATLSPLHTPLAHPCTHTSIPATPAHPPCTSAQRTRTLVRTLGPPPAPQLRSTRTNVQMAHRRLQRAAAAGRGRRTRMRRKDAVPDASQLGRGGGRGRAPDRGCRCCQGDAGWRRRALRLPPPPRLPRVPVGAAPPPQPVTGLDTHTASTHSTRLTHTPFTRCTHIYIHLTHSHHRSAGGAGRDRHPGQHPPLGMSRLPGTTLSGAQSCPLWSAWFRHSWVGPPPAQRASSSRLGVQSPDCPLSEGKPVAPGRRCGPEPAQRQA